MLFLTTEEGVDVIVRDASELPSVIRYRGDPPTFWEPDLAMTDSRLVSDLPRTADEV